MKTAVKKKAAKAQKTAKKNIAKTEKIPWLGSDPFFVTKKEEAIKMLKETGIMP